MTSLSGSLYLSLALFATNRKFRRRAIVFFSLEIGFSPRHLFGGRHSFRYESEQVVRVLCPLKLAQLTSK